MFILQLPQSIPLGSQLDLSQRMVVYRYVRFLYDLHHDDYEPLSALNSMSVAGLKGQMRLGQTLEVFYNFHQYFRNLINL